MIARWGCISRLVIPWLVTQSGVSGVTEIAGGNERTGDAVCLLLGIPIGDGDRDLDLRGVGCGGWSGELSLSRGSASLANSGGGVDSVDSYWSNPVVDSMIFSSVVSVDERGGGRGASTMGRLAVAELKERGVSFDPRSTPVDRCPRGSVDGCSHGPPVPEERSASL